MKNRLKKVLLTLGLLFLLALGVFFFVVPIEVGKRFNQVLNPPPYQASAQARALHQKLLIVDLHADSLLWDRDLLKRGSWGHVDVPRLIEGNVALQAFTVVTKTPRGLNVERNDDRTDNITLLAIADLGDAHWPPPWRPGDVDGVRAALEDLHSTPAPEGLPPIAAERDWLNGWELVAEDREPLLATGLCSPAWLDEALPVLLETGRTCPIEGDAFLHLDVRSDNLCLRDGQAVLVDWNLAHVGNPLLDVVAWLPSLKLEGGPDPWELVPDSEGLAALLAGFFASRAGLPPPETAPTVREFQRVQAEIALPWAAQELGLTPP